jgi:hypothetical protein
MINLALETPLTLKSAARDIPPGRGKRTHLSTLLRWILSGVRDPAGKVVRLEALRIGGRWITSREALQRFAERLTPVASEGPAGAPPRTAGQRERSAARAGEELGRLGI